MACNNCNNDFPIVNVKYGLCSNCNSIRLTGKSLQERLQESSNKFRQKSIERFREKVKEETNNVIKSPNYSIIRRSNKPIRQQTTKDAKIKSELSKVKFSIELEAVQDGSYYCRGCGESHPGLDKSHILSVGQYKHLELLKDNIQLMDRKCHVIWESGTIEQQMKLNCFVDNLQFIYLHDQVAFRKFITRMIEYRDWLIPDIDQAKIREINSIIAIFEN